jgi:hypothetical protein
MPLAAQIAAAAGYGIRTIRCYEIGYARAVASVVKEAGVSLLAGMHVDSAALVRDWRSQVRLDELAQYHELGIPLEGVCVGNELREGSDDPGSKKFTARLSFGMVNVLAAYRKWLDDHNLSTQLTYAMEGIVFDEKGYFNEWLWPLIDACDVVSLNAYSMDNRAWFSFDAFEENRLLLHDARERHLRFALFELRLRRTLDQLARVNKPLFLSETGLPSAVGYHMEGELLVVPESDNARYGETMREYVQLIRRVNQDYDGRIQALWFYEWRDNLHHGAIWNEAVQSPIHTSFGLCDRFGTPKFDIRSVTE